MKKKSFNPIDQKLLHKLFLYDEEGYLIWKNRKPSQFKESKWQKRNCKIWNSNHAGKRAGYNCEGRYIVIFFDGCMCGAHRLIYAYHHGDFQDEIDHINRNGLDNRIENLRIVSRVQNQINVGLKVTNKTGITGVFFEKQRNKWHSQIAVNSKPLFLGRFSNLNDAVLKRYEAEVKYEYLEFLGESTAQKYLKQHNLI